MWVSGIELQSSGLSASTLVFLATPLAQFLLLMHWRELQVCLTYFQVSRTAKVTHVSRITERCFVSGVRFERENVPGKDI